MSICQQANILRHYVRSNMVLAIIAWVGMVTLSGCFTISFNSPVGPSAAIKNISLYDVAIYDNSDFLSIIDIVGIPENMPIYKKTLPLSHRIYVNQLFNPSLKWLAEYDFNNDKALSKGELTQAWLVRTAELILEYELSADSLFQKPNGDPLASSHNLKPLNGLRLPRNQEQYIRDIIDDAISDSLSQEDDDEIIKSTKATIIFIDKMNMSRERDGNQRDSGNDNSSSQDSGNDNDGGDDNDSDSGGSNNFGSDSNDDDGGSDGFDGRQFSG